MDNQSVKEINDLLLDLVATGDVTANTFNGNSLSYSDKAIKLIANKLLFCNGGKQHFENALLYCSDEMLIRYSVANQADSKGANNILATDLMTFVNRYLIKHVLPDHFTLEFIVKRANDRGRRAYCA